MKKSLLLVIAILTAVASVNATNLDNIYGKSSLGYISPKGTIFGNNFGNVLNYNPGDPHFVDIFEAETQIDILDNEISLFQEEIQKYQSKMIEERDQKGEMTDIISQIDLLLIDLRATSAQLYNKKQMVQDRETKVKVQLSIEENRQQIYDLNNRKSSLALKIDELNKSIDLSSRFVTINRIFVNRNTKEIDYLNKCIDFSKEDNKEVDALLDKSSSYQDDVDSLLNKTF